jgi:hypothetical protein
MAHNERDLESALSLIVEIHGQLAKGEVWRGYRPWPTALTGLVGIAAAVAQPSLLASHGAREWHGFLVLWAAAAALNLVIHAATIVPQHARAGAAARRQAGSVLLQLVPCIVCGLITTAVLGAQGEPAIRLLPGLWALMFGLGLFGSRTYLPRGIGWIGTLYFIGGAAMLGLGPHASATVMGWAMGATFGVLQLLTAAILFEADRDEAEGADA